MKKLYSIFFCILLGLLASGCGLIRAATNPAASFATPSPMGLSGLQSTLGEQTRDDAPLATPAPSPTPQPTPDYEAQVLSQADQKLMKGIVNVLLVGVDYADERENWKKYFYSDVMMVLAINFDKNTVDMISVPRDTYAPIANVEGIYKLNSSLYHGGGVPDGFANVCQSVSGVLGGIPVDYYMGVTMSGVKDLVNAIDGVDYDMDYNFKIQGRSYKKGLTHLDGQGVLDYLRVRKGLDNDLGRVNRQKNMLKAIFSKLKSTGTIFQVPALFDVTRENVFTNMNFEQIAALALFGSKLDEANIQMHTMPGPLVNIFNWNFCVIDQAKRVKLIEQVYGIKAKEQVKYGLPYTKWQWNDMLGEGYIQKVETVLAQDDAMRQQIGLLPAKQAMIAQEKAIALAKEQTQAQALANAQANAAQQPTPSPARPAKTQAPTPAPSSPGAAANPATKPTPKPSAKPTAKPTATPKEEDLEFIQLPTDEEMARDDIVPDERHEITAETVVRYSVNTPKTLARKTVVTQTTVPITPADVVQPIIMPTDPRVLSLEARAALEADIAALRKELDAQKKTKDLEKKYAQIEAAANKLKEDATQAIQGKYKIDWFVDENPGKPRLTG